MANPLDRTWYTTLVDDDGSGNVGTVWNKAAVDSLMDAVDASLVPVLANPVPNTTIDFSNNVILRRTTVDGTDNGSIAMIGGGGGAFQVGRGASLGVFGNEDPVWNGSVLIYLGDKGGSGFRVYGGTPFGALFQIDHATGQVYLANGGVTFPVTQKPSADPYTFDDYRELPFTPTLTGTGGSSGVTYAAQRGGAVKFGRYVIAQFDLSLTSMGTISGNLLIGGLPIATDGVAYLVQMCQVDWHSTATAFVGLSAQLEPSQPNALRLLGRTAASTTSIGAPLTAAAVNAATSFYGTIIFRSTN